MPIRDRIIWGQGNPFGDPRLVDLERLVRDIRRHGRLPYGVSGGSVFENRLADFPIKPRGYYREYDVQRPGMAGRGKLRIVLGSGGEVYITGNHYREYQRADGSIAGESARLIDYDEPDNNDWLVVNQFTVVEAGHNRRADIAVFVNGLPLVVIELKNPGDEDATIWTAFSQLQTYKHEIPTCSSITRC